ncbi:MAG: cobyrinate a,c-diamide synthase, partial [Planctomycetota bacterium]
CTALDPRVNVAAILLNRVGTARQERVIREAIRRISGPPVVGAIPRLESDPLPGRHLGLVTAVEHPRREEAVKQAARAIEAHTDLDTLLDTARSAPATTVPHLTPSGAGEPVRVGVFRDKALSFYYPENLEALEDAGATLVFVSPLDDRTLPDVDALYFGGGFPEVHVERLADNRPMREAVGDAAADGMPVYAECGGLMFLARELIVEGVSHPMAGVLDLVVEQGSKPEGHGYVEAEVDQPNPFFTPGTRLRGHEFHYSRVVAGSDAAATTLRLHRGRGVGARRDGLVSGRVWASYLHLHALGTPAWATSLTALARSYRQERAGSSSGRGSGGSPVGDGGGDVGGDDEQGHGIEQGGQRVVAAGA